MSCDKAFYFTRNGRQVLSAPYECGDTRARCRGTPAVLPRVSMADVGYGLSGVTGRKPTIISNHVAACDRSAAGHARPTRDGLGRRILSSSVLFYCFL
ncbi:hypothetical protein EVAR_93030_1 [Eumeta japonica]|uniref:Uncharacterized protein n=1 Tax=Eumeta variegata TaxID=151549 RepID=A0A4C1SC24_EUMVA|nr:hypothetical protein EVAR_93030_1 [Eumeta japonica]